MWRTEHIFRKRRSHSVLWSLREERERDGERRCTESVCVRRDRFSIVFLNHLNRLLSNRFKQPFYWNWFLYITIFHLKKIFRVQIPIKVNSYKEFKFFNQAEENLFPKFSQVHWLHQEIISPLKRGKLLWKNREWWFFTGSNMSYAKERMIIFLLVLIFLRILLLFLS